MDKNNKIQLGIILISILTSVIAYFYLPESIATHWNYLGQPDQYSGKLVNLIAFPCLLTFIWVILKAVPKMDPLQKNIHDLSYNSLITLISLFFLLIQYFMILWNIGIQISVSVMFPSLLAMLFYFIGDSISKSKQNWTMGIRTKWTLSSEKVWKETHELGGKLFKASVPVLVLSMLIPSLTFAIDITYLVGVSIFLIAYSYFQFKKEEGNK